MIDWKTKRCLREGRFGYNSFLKQAWRRSSNLLFSLLLVALMVTVVRFVYQMPVSISLESKIRAGEQISNSEVPTIVQAIGMRTAALEQEAKMQVKREMQKYAERFGIDVSMAKLVFAISRDENLDPELIFRLIWAESRFKTNCIGDVGEIGLMQIKYATALQIDPGATRKKLFDPAYNIRIGIKHLKDHLHFFRGDTRLALLAYNRGRGKVNQLLQMGENPANGYVKKVLETNM